MHKLTFAGAPPVVRIVCSAGLLSIYVLALPCVLTTGEWTSPPNQLVPVPFGTGNELANAIGWGSSLSSSRLHDHLTLVLEHGAVCQLDR